jgi:transcriptional regulator with XRE-family HTH domain
VSDPVTAPFAASLRRLRRERKWSQRDLAAESGVSIATISSVERELCGPGLKVAILLARAFGVRLDEMAAGNVEGSTRVQNPAQKNWSRCDP